MEKTVKPWEYCVMTEAEWLTTEQVAKELQVNVQSVRKWINSGELEASQIGKGYRVSREDLRTFMEKRKRRQRTDKSPDSE
jgi:excisionase family DNA binding protein